MSADDSWNRFPEAKVRMRENGLKAILEGLGEEGFCIGAEPRLQLLEDGVYVEMVLNVGKHGNIVALPLEVFIPAELPKPEKKKKSKKEQVASVTNESTTALVQKLVENAIKAEEKEIASAVENKDDSGRAEHGQENMTPTMG